MSLQPPKFDYDAAFIEIGGADRITDDKTLTEMSLAPAMAHRVNPKATIQLMVAGYDDDPRSLWEIPEVVVYVQRYAKLAGLMAWDTSLFQALDEQSKALLLKCDAVNKPHPYRVEIGP